MLGAITTLLVILTGLLTAVSVPAVIGVIRNRWGCTG